MHADEAILADKFGTLLEQGRFEYDPRDYHGPVLEYATLVSAWLSGRHTYRDLDERVLRIVPAAAGVAVALSPLLLAGVIGPMAAVSAGLLIAISAPMVFYSRDYIPEMLLALFTAVFVAQAARGKWIAAGLFAGLAVCTKETAVIAIAAGLLAFARPRWDDLLRFSIPFAAAPLLLLGPADIGGAAVSYWNRAGSVASHVHPWHYYLLLLVKGAPAVLIGAVAAAAMTWWKSANRRWAVYAGVVIAVYSAIPYKTPWCVVSMLWALAVLAGCAVRDMGERGARWGAVAFGLLAAASVVVGPKTELWGYAETTPDVFRIAASVRRFAPDTQTRIGVYTTENLWPLPWYLRMYPNARWSRQGPGAGSGRPPAIVLVTPELESQLTRALYESPPPGERELYVPMFPQPVEIRRGVEISGYVAKSVYDGAAE